MVRSNETALRTAGGRDIGVDVGARARARTLSTTAFLITDSVVWGGSKKVKKGSVSMKRETNCVQQQCRTVLVFDQE